MCILFQNFKKAMTWALKARVSVDEIQTCMLGENLINMPDVSRIVPGIVSNKCHFSAISRFVNHSSLHLQNLLERIKTNNKSP